MPEPHAPFPTVARYQAAAALRALSHAMVGHEIDDEHLADITEWAGEKAKAISAKPRRQAPPDERGFVRAAPPGEGDRMHNFPDSVISGDANPLGLAMPLLRRGDTVVSRFTLGPAYEGAPGRAHGGMAAAVLDEAMGFVLGLCATPAYTGRLQLRYLAPVPIDVEVDLVASLRERHGRKLTLDGAISLDGRSLVEAEGLFVAVAPDHFVNPERPAS